MTAHTLTEDLTPGRVSIPAFRYIIRPAREAHSHHASFRDIHYATHALFSQLYQYPNFHSLSLHREAWTQLFGSTSTMSEEQAFALRALQRFASRITKLKLPLYWASGIAAILDLFPALTFLDMKVHAFAMNDTALEQVRTVIEACKLLQSLRLELTCALEFRPIALASISRSPHLGSARPSGDPSKVWRRLSWTSHSSGWRTRYTKACRSLMMACPPPKPISLASAPSSQPLPAARGPQAHLSPSPPSFTPTHHPLLRQPFGRSSTLR